MKEKIKVIFLILMCLIIAMISFFSGYNYASFSSDYPFIDSNNYGSYRMESYSLDKYLSFSKYYYYEDSDKSKVNNENYNLVEDNVEMVKENISISLNKFSELDNPIEIDFDYDNVTPNDYYCLENGKNSVNLYYYDMDEYIFYTISFPIEN